MKYLHTYIAKGYNERKAEMPPHLPRQVKLNAPKSNTVVLKKAKCSGGHARPPNDTRRRRKAVVEQARRGRNHIDWDCGSTLVCHEILPGTCPTSCHKGLLKKKRINLSKTAKCRTRLAQQAQCTMYPSQKAQCTISVSKKARCTILPGAKNG